MTGRIREDETIRRAGNFVKIGKIEPKRYAEMPERRKCLAAQGVR
jgi:N-dimethylarginine dimethylaminohydrolase